MEKVSLGTSGSSRPARVPGCWDVDLNLVVDLNLGGTENEINSVLMSHRHQAVPMSLPKMSPTPGTPCSFFFVTFPPVWPPVSESFLLSS